MDSKQSTAYTASAAASSGVLAPPPPSPPPEQFPPPPSTVDTKVKVEDDDHDDAEPSSSSRAADLIKKEEEDEKKPTLGATVGHMTAPSQPSKGKAPEEASEFEPVDLSDIDRILAMEATGVQREEEANRILSAFKLNPYDIMGVDKDVTIEELHKIYRKKSLMIHPDRFHHPRGPEAFDLLKKAQQDLLDEEKRKAVDRIIADARMLILRGLGLGPDTPDSHDKVRFLLPPMRERVKAKTKELMVDEEIRRRRTVKMTMIAEGAEAQRVEKAQEERKRKAEEKAKWEDSREARVTDWRSFQKGGSKKKRPKVLG